MSTFSSPPSPNPPDERPDELEGAAPEGASLKGASAARGLSESKKWASLPDFEDEARPRREARRGAGWGGPLASGCMSGVLANALLGFVLVALQRSGVDVYGPGAVAIVAGLTLLLCALVPLSRQAMLFGASFVAGLLLFYGVIYVLVRPALNMPEARPEPVGQSQGAAPKMNEPREAGAPQPDS